MSLDLHLSPEQLKAGLPYIRLSPRDNGTLEMIVRRPAVNQREVVEEAELDVRLGLVGDIWSLRPAWKSPQPNPDAQITLINARAVALVAGSRERWPLAGDQLYVDLDLSAHNISAGTQLVIGEAIVEITAEPHNGCRKFSSRFGTAATKFVNSQEGKFLHLRGVNAKVIHGGIIKMRNEILVRRKEGNTNNH